MGMRYRLIKQEPQKRERERAFRRAQTFHAKFRRRFADRFRQVVENIEARITDEIVEVAASIESAEFLIRNIPIGVYAPLTKAGLKESALNVNQPPGNSRIHKQDDDDFLPFLSFDDQLQILLAELVREKGELEVSILLDQLTLGPAARARAAEFSFDLVNPSTLAWLRNHRLDLIRQIRSSTESSIRSLITQAVEEGVDTATTARRIRETIGLTTKQAESIANLRTALEADGLPQFEVRNLVSAARQRKIKQRADLIARTEITRAESQGQLDTWRQAMTEGLLGSDVLKRWVAGSSIAAGGKADPICRALHNARPVSVDGNFQTDFGAFDAPPAHPGCRCTLVLAFAEDVAAEEEAATEDEAA